MRRAAESRNIASLTEHGRRAERTPTGGEIMNARRLGSFLLALFLAGATGCKVRVDKSSDGDNVKIATPFGGIAVNKDQTSAAELGLPAYPGAAMDTGGDGNKSAKVDMGFGAWRLRVKVAHYTTTDNRDQVAAFYRQALSAYGSVIECAGDRSVGTTTATVEGLTCDHSDHDPTPRGNFSSDDLELKAGSPRHQHLVVLKGGRHGATQFSLIALDLPHGLDNQQKGTN
jgi:hypothetical protein